jgi:hypothetical protein
MTAGTPGAPPRPDVRRPVWEEVTIREHDRDALCPDLVEIRRDSGPRSCRRCWCEPRVHREVPSDPRLADVFVPAVGCCRQSRHPLPPQRRLAGELAPSRLPSGIGVEREDQLADLAHPQRPAAPRR